MRSVQPVCPLGSCLAPRRAPWPVLYPLAPSVGPPEAGPYAPRGHQGEGRHQGRGTQAADRQVTPSLHVDKGAGGGKGKPRDAILGALLLRMIN